MENLGRQVEMVTICLLRFAAVSILQHLEKHAPSKGSTVKRRDPSWPHAP